MGAEKAKNRTKSVKNKEEIATQLGHPSCIETTPTIDAATKLTKLLPNRINAISLSSCFKSFSANIAPLFPFFDRFLTRYLFRRINAVSVPAKKADSIINKASIVKSVPKGISSLKDSDSFIIVISVF